MNTTIWNCQGLGNDPTVRRLKELHKKFLPDIICLSETKKDNNYLRDTACFLGFQNVYTIPPEGLSGGLAILWNSTVCLDVISACKNLIDCFVQLNGIGFYYSFVYGHPVRSKRNEIWELLERIGVNRRNQPWIVVGDFNEILDNSEKKGGRQRPQLSFNDFRRTLRNCNLRDLKCVGDRYSWVGTRGNHHVSCCLDRVMSNPEWLNQFPASVNQYLEFEESDHRPMLLQINSEDPPRRNFFIYDGRLTVHEGFSDAIKQGWRQPINSQSPIPLSSRLAKCREQISNWKRQNRSNARERIAILKRKLDIGMATGTLTTDSKKQIEHDLHSAYIDEEIFWYQKSRKKWIREGDRNTTYFHHVTKQRRQKQCIRAITSEDGAIHFGSSRVAQIAIDYFKCQYTSTPIQQTDIDQAFFGFQTRVSSTTNDQLIRPVTTEEIKKAVFAIGSSKAPGPDGFTAAFYQNHWEDINQELILEIKSFFNEDIFDQSNNHTNLCLIPKTTTPTSMSDYRPIALCNVSYKVISKILINRLKTYLSDIISPNQAAFVPGRMITDNTIIAQEMFHSLKYRKRQSRSYMAVKTDITKAYDRLEWRFLAETMNHMGFHPRWIKWIMLCVSSVTYSVLINGVPHGFIKPCRGLRQGDPLSPYLFILCAEVLSHLMSQAEATRKIHPMKLGTHGIGVSHLLFADDSLFFTLANKHSGENLKKIFTLYERVSGQSINFRKSSITFGAKVSGTTRTFIRNLLGIHNEGGGKYLGLPEELQRKKADTFQYILQRVREKTKGWSKKFLSPGGKEIMLKAVASAMPVYCMNIFKLPKGVTDDLDKLMADYWWDKGDQKNGKHWIAWKRLCKPKRDGGLGFRDFEAFNLALLAKQVWRIFQHPGSLMARVIKGKYFSQENILTVRQRRGSSFVWNSLLQGRDLLKQGLRFVIGDGSLVNVWSDPWLPEQPPRPPRPRTNEAPPLMVSSLINQGTGQWNLTAISATIADEDIPKVLALKLCASAREDMLGWHYNSSGQYTVKSGYWLATNTHTDISSTPIPGCPLLKKKIWKINTASKLKHFLWKSLSDILPTGDVLHRRHISDVPWCPRCCDQIETLDHILFLCPYATSVWRQSGVHTQSYDSSVLPVMTKIETLLTYHELQEQQFNKHLPLWLVWRLWKSRNILLYQRRQIPWQVTLSLANQDTQEWISAVDHIQTLSTNTSTNTTNNNTQRTTTRHHLSKWQPPINDWIKCNYDGSWRANMSSQAGWIIRDSNRQHICSGQFKGPCLASPLDAEFQALSVAMQHVLSLGYRKAIFEGDNSQIPKLLNGQASNIVSFNWIRECRKWKTEFHECEFLWTNRENNRVADQLAKLASNINVNSGIVYNSIPYEVVNICSDDYYD